MRLCPLISLLFLSICVLQACGDDGPLTPPIEEWCDLNRPREDCKADDFIISHGVEDARILCETPCTQLGQLFINQGDSEIFKALHGFRSASTLLISNAHASVKDLSFLSHFEYVKTLEVKGNRGLETLNGLEWIESMVSTNCDGCGASIVIEANPKLRSLAGLRNLIESDGIRIDRNDSLEAENVFPKLKSGGVAFVRNQTLTTISGFESMIEIDSSITIRSNTNLRKVDAWPNLTKLNALAVEGNRSLDECEVQRILDQLEEVPRTVIISDNGSPCVR